MRILLIEDNSQLASSLKRNLEDNDCYVDIATDGDEGLYRATNWQFDCIVLDLMLPRINGQHVLTAIRKAHDTPVLVISSLASTSERIKMLDLGADDFLVKPFETEELFARIRSLVRRADGSFANSMTFGDLEIDISKKRIFKNNKEVTLTKREYDILALLLKRKGRLVETAFFDEYLSGIQGFEDRISNSLQVHMHNLRRKIGKEFIQTVHGQGYRFIVKS